MRIASVRRWWLDLKQGHNFYIAFVLSLLNFIIISYSLALERLPLLNQIFPNMWMWVAFFIVTYIPLTITLGHFHRQEQLPTEQNESALQNPVTMFQMKRIDDIAETLEKICQRLDIKDVIGLEMLNKGIDIAKLNSIARQRAKARTRTQLYERFRNKLLQYPVPSQTKLNYIQRSSLYNVIRNSRYVTLARSLIYKCVSLLSFDRGSESMEFTHFSGTQDSESMEFTHFSGTQKAGHAVHQFIPVLSPRDAAGNEVIAIRDMLRKLGYRSDIFVEVAHPEMYQESKKFTDYAVSSPNDVIIYHMASYSKLVNSILALPGRKIMVYHNITPHEYFTGINDEIVRSCRRGREQLHLLKNGIDLAIVHSEYSKMELVEIGFKNIVVAPVYINFDKYKRESKKNLTARYANSTNLLYVGRIVPHKKIEELLQIFAYYNNCIDSNSNLFIVGNYLGMERYYMWLKNLILKAKLRNVQFVHNADDSELVTYYNLADAYISMSEHEGFCIPMVESMYFGVPIIAYDSTSIPYTLGDAGIRVNEKNFEEIAELIGLIVYDDNVRNKIIEKQKERLDAIRQDNTLERTLATCLQEVWKC